MDKTEEKIYSDILDNLYVYSNDNIDYFELYHLIIIYFEKYRKTTDNTIIFEYMNFLIKNKILILEGSHIVIIGAKINKEKIKLLLRKYKSENILEI